MKKKRFIHRFVAGVLSLALVVGLGVTLVLNSGTAQAVTSLPHIVEILDSQSVFNVLEIVPSAGKGSLGYYVGGQEPFDDWETAFSEPGAYTNRADRNDYANNLLASLEGAGLLSRSDSTPLLYSGSETDYSYTEQYFWELTEPDGTTDLTGWRALPLPEAESAVVNGTFAEGSGNYDAVYEYVFNAGGGSYAQNIHKFFIPDDDDPLDAYYYYQPTFGNVDFFDQEADGYFMNLYGQAVYTNTEADGSGDFIFYGIINDDVSLNINVNYYYVTDTGTPTPAADLYNAGTDTFEIDGYYAADSDSFVPDASGYFDREITRYNFIPDGTGAYSFVPDAAGPSNTVSTDLVYYQGTISNNDWFLKNVFDIESPSEGDIFIEVRSVTPSELTEAMIGSANLIVLSAGFDPSTPGISLAAGYSSNDISALMAYSIYDTALADTCPLIVDYRLTSLPGGLNTARLAQLCLMPYTDSITEANFAAYSYTWEPPAMTNFVAGNIYCFNSPFEYSEASTIPDLATSLFVAGFSDSVIENGFSDVVTEIKNENFLRKVDDPDTADLLTEEVTVANTIRYIINFAGQRVITTKTAINVLDLEPGNAKSGALTTETVLGWLGPETAFEADDITVTTMSTAEFIGKIEDINETYDLVYIGTCIDGFNTKTNDGETVTNYNDISMDGLVYSNIGDTYYSNHDFRGLLYRDSDYNLQNLFRFSGNDITPSKVEELLHFAQAGYPVILSNDIFMPSLSEETSTFYVDVTASVDDEDVTLSATAIDSGSDTPIEATFRWYRVGSATVLHTDTDTLSSEYTFEALSGEYEYYCTAEVSNPASDARSDNILVVRSSGLAVTVDTDSSRETGSYGGSVFYEADLSCSPSDDIENGDTVTATATAVDTNGNPLTGYTSISYQWYGRVDGSWTALSGATTGTLPLTASISGSYFGGYTYLLKYGSTTYSNYRCQISVNGGTPAVSNYFYLDYTWSWFSRHYYIAESSAGSSSGYYDMPTTYFYADVSGSPSGSGATLTAQAVDTLGNPLSGSFSYYWYYYNSRGRTRNYGGGASIYVTLGPNETSRTFFCRADAAGSSDVAYSYDIIVSRGGISATVQGSGALDGAYYKTDYFSTGDVNMGRVDSTSYVYEAVTDIKDRANVMSVSEIDSSTLQSYLSLSKPEIDLASYPTVYDNDGGTMTAMAGDTLNYTFTIRNETDPTPATTTYDCRLYIDLNADGRYSEGEVLDDIRVTDGGAVVYPETDGEGDEYYRLSAGGTYSVSRQVPEEYVGIIPWKLEIVKNGAERIHASIHNYTRIAPDPVQVQQISVLQIADDDLSDSGTSNIVNLEEQQEEASYYERDEDLYSSVTNTYYKGIYGKLLADVTDFNVVIKTVEAHTLEDLQFDGFTPPDGTDTEKIYAYLDTFDMVIIGFNDMYGEIRADTATAITQYIDSGKSILFTHDTTSFYNTNIGWGYYFNTIIRDKVGLDRYGITSDELRDILYYETSGTNLTSAEIAEILDSDYSVAYDHNTASGTVAETQGFTNYELIRYGESYQLEYTDNTYNERETTYVSQVNEGQITTYPYDINTAAFKGTGSTDYMSVLETHEQYYQLNMNPDDIVVWFCLSSGPNTSGYYYNDLPNDAVNAYYIYNRGNVTYSGVGHTSATSNYSTNLSTAATNESKLFVNTMIAAYQSGKQDPTVEITSDKSGDEEIEYLYYHTDYNGTGTLEEMMDPDNPSRIVCFKLGDTNLDADKVITLRFFYDTGGGKREFESGLIYQANDVAATTLKGGKVYYVYLPDAVLGELGENGVTSVDLTIRATTTIGSMERYGEDSIELRVIDLFSLR